MRSFFDLVGFEYKKIFKRKGSIISLVIIAVLTVVCPVLILIGNVYIDGEPVETYYQAMIKDREYARVLSGRYIDETLVREVKEAYSKVSAVGGNELYSIPEYQEHARPYSGVYYILNTVYTAYGNRARQVINLTEEEMQSFYQIRHGEVLNWIDTLHISSKSKDKLIQLDSEIEIPFVYSYSDAYWRFFAIMSSTGIFGAFAVAVCLAPMFAGEYGTGADQLILSSKFGKNKIITAKLFTGVSFCAVLYLIMIALTYLVCCGIYGLDGGNAPVQLWAPFCIYPFTMWQAAAVYSICILFAAILVCTLTLLLSSIFKSPFGVIIIISLLIFVPMMFRVPSNTVLMNLYRLLPSNMMSDWAVLIEYTTYEVFGMTIMPCVFMPLFAVLTTGIILPFAYRAFKNHQIG